MKSGHRAIWVLVGGIVVLALVGGIVWGWRAIQIRAAAESAIPVRPAASRMSPDLADRIDVAEQRTHSLTEAKAGLSELARLYHANGFLPEAEQCEEALLTVDAANPLWPYLRANIVGSYGNLEKALPLVRRAIDLAPDYLPAQVRLGDMLLKLNQTAEAAAVYRAVLSRDPDDGFATMGLARAELAEGRPLRARELLQSLVTAQPEFAPAWGLLIGIDEQLGDQSAAVMHRAQSRQAGRPREMPDPWIDGLMSDCYDAYRLTVAAAAADPANNQARARELLERAVMIAPQNDLPFRLLGNLLSDLGELKAARGYLERATVIQPKNPDNWSYLVKLLKGLGDISAANRALDTGLSHCPDAPVLHLERGRRLAAAGQLDAAAAAFKWSRQLRPEDSTASMELAHVYFRQGLLEQGVAELHTVVKSDPSHPVAVVLLARYAISNGDKDGALKWIGQARGEPRVPPRDMDLVTEEFRAQFGRSP